MAGKMTGTNIFSAAIGDGLLIPGVQGAGAHRQAGRCGQHML